MRAIFRLLMFALFALSGAILGMVGVSLGAQSFFYERLDSVERFASLERQLHFLFWALPLSAIVGGVLGCCLYWWIKKPKNSELSPAWNIHSIKPPTKLN
jgi:hypothetical protein